MTTRQNVPLNFGDGGAGLTPGGSSVPAVPTATQAGPLPPPNPDLATVLWALLARVAPSCATYALLASFGAGPAPSNSLDRQHGQVVLAEPDNRLWRWNSTSTSAAGPNVFLAGDAPAAGRWTAVAPVVPATPTVPIDLKGAVLAAGTPLAAFAGSGPGITLDNGKAVGVRWHGGTLTTVWTAVDLPLDLDPTFPVTAVFLVSKGGTPGTTATDVASVTVAAYAQTVGALEDAGANLGGVSTALTSLQAALPAKTVTRLTATIYLPPTVPARLSVSVTPSGTLATDDLIVNGSWLEYTRRNAVPTLSVDFRAGVLAAGTPMAAFADNAASQPGVTLDNSHAVGVRWNDAATQVAVWSSVELPADFDVAKPCVVTALVSKSGATSGDAVTLDVAVYEQVPGALEDAGSNLGGTTTAIAAPTATAKTVSKLTLGVPGGTFTAGGARLSVSVKPTNGTLGTDDCVLNGFWIEYQKVAAPNSPMLAVDLKASVLAAGTPMAAWANNAGASAPGVRLNNSKAVGVRWNNFATQTAVWSERDLPADFDASQPATVVVLASKSGANALDATAFDVGLYEQVPGSLEDAGPSFTGTTTALAPSATAKTVSRLTLAVPGGTLTNYPGRLSVSLKPHDGTNLTDDVLACGFWIEYTPRAA